jgi:hypothetical protein
MRIIILVALPFMFCLSPLYGQGVVQEDESRLYAQTKQVNQFFRRFNGEEDEKGERYYPKDKPYRNVKLRKKYLGILFDEANTGISSELKIQFARDVLDKADPAVLNFHGGEWFCEVRSQFTQQGKTIPVILFMELEKAQLGSKWVISKVHADGFTQRFKRDTAKVGQFLHPLSHELDFMNLRRAFLNPDSVTQYVSRHFQPDYLTLFISEVQKGNLKFKTVEDIRFHFFQIDGWYFELAQFIRPGYNTGWLIANLVKLKDETEKDLLKRYLYNEAK